MAAAIDLSIWFNWIVDHIPLWVWLTIAAAGAGATFYFFSPILLPIWAALPAPVRVALIGVGAALLAFLGGRYRGRANAEEEERRRNADALAKRTEVDREVSNLSDKQAEDRLRDRWSRD
ncbi:hypothetical protein [Bradyrhizobium sp. CCBAU 51753]|uniref:hypothetical protein n=1 Tax=Bradyrhizobium sp. CCBAU 51753 TaxID=1325100 RepID=UPI00188BC73E|nr:hypothetical protein [Bradyrhizobium sp. CCBAU 51753]